VGVNLVVVISPSW